MTPQQKITQRTREVLARAFAMYGIEANPESVEISFNLTGRTAGWAERNRGHYRLRYNLEAYHLDPVEMIEDTVPHEVAHIVCYMRPELGNSHDAGWRRVCQALGGSGKRTHDLELTPAKVTERFTYMVGRERVEIGPTQHQRLQSRRVVYFTRTRQQIHPEHWVDYVAKAAKTVSEPVTVRPGAIVNKRAAATLIMRLNPNLTRAEIIKKFVAEVGLTPAGAATYYYNIKNGK